VLEELGIGQIAALSPQAKGRVERLRRTFQDQPRSGVRLGGAATLEACNAALEKFIQDHTQLGRTGGPDMEISPPAL